MRKSLFFLTLGQLCLSSLIFSCEYVKEEWHRQYPADVQEHHSPVPEHNAVAPDESGSATREVIDTYSQEDHSDVHGNGENQVKTDQPLEEHLEEMVNCQGKGDAGEGEEAAPLPCSKLQHYNTRENFNTGQSLSREDVFGDGNQKGENHYSIKNTTGMIYKTDQTTCDTAFEHPTTGYSSGEAGKETNHDFVFDANGDVIPNSDDKYCFFILIPGNGNLDGKIARVDPEDENSRNQIKNGNASYISLSDSDLNKLNPGSGDLHFVKGRYITPMPEGKILLPTNSPQMLFNRTTVYRPYFQDVKRATAGSVTSAGLLNQLDNTFKPVQETGGKSEFFEIDGISARMNGLNHKTSLVTKASDENVGSKLSTWGKELVGPQYLAVGPSGDPAKRLNVALHFPNNDSEEEYLDSITNGTFDPNKNRDPISTERKIKLLDEAERQELLSDAVKFQMKVSGQYVVEDGDAAFDPNLTKFDPNALKDTTPVASCAETDADAQVYCKKYAPLRENLRAVYADLGINDIAGADEIFEQLLTAGPFNQTIMVGGETWNVSAARKRIGEFQNKNAVLLNDLNHRVENSDADRMDSGFSKYVMKTEEGIEQKTRLIKLQSSWLVDAKVLAEKNLINRNEHNTFIAKTDSLSGKSDPEFQTEIVKLANQRYQVFELNNMTRGAFLYYTSQDPEGQKLMTKLALIQRGTNQPEPNKLPWRALVPESIINRCAANTAVRDCRTILDNTETTPINTDKNYRTLRYDPDASPLTIEFIP